MSIYGGMGTKNRISGISSGFDTDQLVYAYTMRQRAKVDTLFQNKTLTQYKKEAYQNINLSFAKFTNSYTSMLGGTTSLRSPSLYNFYKMTASSNASGVVDITAGSNASLDSVTIVQTRAGTSTSVSSDLRGVLNSFDRNTKLSDLGIREGEKIEVIDPNNPSAENSIEITADMTVNDFIKAFNGLKLGVNMKYDEINKTFKLQTDAVGFDAYESFNNFIKMNEGDDFGGVAEAMGFDLDDITVGDYGSITFRGSNPITLDANNSATLNGITYKVVSDFDSSVSGESPITASASKNYDDFISRVKAMLTEFNTLYASVYNQLKSTQRNDLKPLTDEQKLEMNETDITNWENAIRESVLSRDSKLSKLAGELRNIFSGEIPGSRLTFADIGITSGAYKSGQPTEFVLDEDKLIAALDADPESVKNLFTASTSTFYSPTVAGSYQTKYNESGLLDRLDLVMTSFIRDVNTNVIDNKLNVNLRNFDKDIKTQQDRLAQMEEAYYVKLAKMEQALSQMQSQSNWVSSQMGSL